MCHRRHMGGGRLGPAGWAGACGSVSLGRCHKRGAAWRGVGHGHSVFLCFSPCHELPPGDSLEGWDGGSNPWDGGNV